MKNIEREIKEKERTYIRQQGERELKGGKKESRQEK